MVGLRDTLSYQNFSWKGDPRWASLSKFTRHAPTVVFILCVVSMVLVALGSTWLVQMTHVTFPKIFQTLFIPGLSFFNTIPSLHAHLLLRRNPPGLALVMGTLFLLMMLLSPLLMIASCVGPATSSPGLRQTECFRGAAGKGGDSGVSLSVWTSMIVFSVISAIGYGVHATMAWKVRQHLRWRTREGIVEAPDPDEEERRKKKAHELWVQMTRLEGL